MFVRCGNEVILHIQVDRRPFHTRDLPSRDCFSSLFFFSPPLFFKPSFVVERYVGWMVHPYGVSAAIALSAAAVYLAFNSGSDSRSNALMGFYFTIAVYLIVCACQLRDSLLARPHPVFWRLIKGLAFLYCFGLVWLAFQNVDDARQVLHYWEPSLGTPLVEHSYATQCEIYTPFDPVSSFRNISDAIFDTFMVCHLLGWFCKMLMIRDLRVTLAASLLFEVYELTFTHMLPNFKECWWDTIILDVIMANGLGIVGGYYFLRFFQCKEYNFLYSLEGRWKPLVSFRYLVGVVVLLASLAAIELNAFFLKYLLWVPPPHHLNFWRVVFWWLLGCAGTREWYHWMQNPGAPLGMMISLIFLCAGLETLICVKFGIGVFPTPMPAMWRNFWIGTFVLLGLFCALYYPIQHYYNAKSSSSSASVVTTVVTAAGAAEGAPPVEIKVVKKKGAVVVVDQ